MLEDDGVAKLLVLLREQVMNAQDEAILRLDLERFALVAEEVGVVPVSTMVSDAWQQRKRAR